MATIKRKGYTQKQESRKRQRKDVDSIDNLPWKIVSRSTAAGFEGDDGVLMLEEVDGVEVTYEETAAGKVAKFKIVDSDGPSLTNDGSQVMQSDSVVQIEQTHGGSVERTNSESSDEPDNDSIGDSEEPSEWAQSFNMSKKLCIALKRQGFTSPTPIQAKSLPVALSGKDIIGVAETGSGKTLAYGLPILNFILSNSHKHREDKNTDFKRQLSSLIIAPTRELALQVVSHLKACIEPPVKQDPEGSAKTKRPPPVSIAAIVGGMSAQKQRRLLDRGVDILVATPGRLWDLLEEDSELAGQLGHLRFLVLDEADRMIEIGHFAELESIIRLTMRQEKTADEDPFDKGSESTDEDGKSENAENMQTFVFSATLSKDLQQNLRKKPRQRQQSQKRKDGKPSTTLDELLLKLDFRDPQPEIIDLSPIGGVVSTLQESRVECLSGDKDVYLYYFLLRYPGRSLVFLSSIDGIRRLLPVLELLQLKAFPLHSQLQQRQRLKNLDRFKSTPNAILLSTDIAARGLDIPSVEHVIHYQIPRTADSYIHRNGRTARAKKEGFSLLMCAPDERRLVRALMTNLERGDENDIPEMPIELDLLDKLKKRVQLARKIDVAQHRVRKEKHEKNWMKEAAEAMEIELDSDLADSDEDAESKKHKHLKEVQSATMKTELNRLLSQPLLAKGVSAKYLTSGTRDVVNKLLDSTGHETMIGYAREDAKCDLARKKSIQKGSSARSIKSIEVDWTGFDS